MAEKKSKTAKLATASADLLADQLAQLKGIFPEAFTEGKVDFEKLRMTLGDVVDDGPERYTFAWAGKRDAIRLLQTPTRATLVPCREESINFDETQHLFIEGDNLEVLKLLYKPYFGRVKMIYIDPPYNTGNDFIYRDNYVDPLGAYLQLTGQQDAEGNVLTSNPETSGRYHSAWLSMMYPRLFLARRLLREDGVIFVSIDDHEVHNLRVIMNELYGEENFLAEFVWEGALKNDSRFVSISHDYIICFARNKVHLQMNDARWRTRKEGIDHIYDKVEELKTRHGEDYQAISEDLRIWYSQLNKNHPAWSHRHYDSVDVRGVYFPGDISWPGGGGPKYEVIHPATGKPVRVPSGGWRFASPDTMAQVIAEHRIEFGPDETTIPTVKRYLHDTEGQVLPSVIYRDRRGASRRLKALFGVKVFDNPKDEEVLMKLVEAATNETDFVLDFFAGSCPLSKAVFSLNRLDGGNRRFICVQLPEPVDETGPSGRNAFNLGLKNVADIGKERIRRVIAKLKKEKEGQLPLKDRDTPEDLGFKVFKLAESNYRNWPGVEERTPDAYTDEMALFRDPLVDDWNPGNVVYEVALKEGYGLTCRIERVAEAEDATVHRVTDPDKEQSFYICLDNAIQLENLKPLGLTQEAVFVCRDVALDDDAAANLALQCRLKTI